MSWTSRIGFDMRDTVEVYYKIIQNFLNNWHFPMSVNFRSLDLLSRKTVGYGAENVHIKFIKCQTTEMLFWPGVPNGKKK